MAENIVTVRDLVNDFKLEDAWLNTKFETTHLDIAEDQDFSSDFSGESDAEWQKWVMALSPHLEPADLKDLTDTTRCKQVLGKWRKKHGRKATFRRLVEVFLEGDNADLAEKVCKYLKGMQIILLVQGSCMKLQGNPFP